MVIVTNIAFWAVLVPAAAAFFFLARRYKQLRNYTFWVEQCLLQHRPETYIPQWRKRQRVKDICLKVPASKHHVQTLTKPATESRLEIPSLE